MEIQHRYFVQYMLKNGAVTVDKALNYCQNIPGASINDVTQLRLLVLVINREISKQFFKIVLTTCEVTNQELFVWVNNKNDDISKLQITFSAIELEYFQVILQEILNSEEYRLTFVVVLNLTSILTSNFTRDSGQKVLKKWLDGGYFVKKERFVYLGPRLILEFTSYLKAHRPDQLCKLCSELVFTGKNCGLCDQLLHSYCLEKYLKNQQNCPSCRKNWIERPSDVPLPNTQESQNSQNGYINGNSAAEMDSDSNDEPIPGTSSESTQDMMQRKQNSKNRKAVSSRKK